MRNSPHRPVQVRPLSGGLGAEILDLDVANLSDGQYADIHQAFAEFGVIFFRDQQLSPEQHIAFASRWGDININRFFQAVDGYPQIAEVKKDPEQKENIGGGWHTDHSYDQRPALGSMLYAHEVPDSGGDTLFASMYRAFDSLSDGMKQLLSGLFANHSSRHVFGAHRYEGSDEYNGRVGNPELATQDATHPVIITHPLSGRKALYVNPGFTLGIDGWSKDESGRVARGFYIVTPYARNSLVDSDGKRVHSLCGTIVPPGTTRLTTIRASAATCTESPLKVRRWPHKPICPIF